MASLTIDFYQDVVCCWCFNISSRMRKLTSEFDRDIWHHTIVLQASRTEMAARGCKAAERIGGQASQWAMFDWLQRAHLTEARKMAEPEIVLRAARRMGFESAAFGEIFDDQATAPAVEEDRQRAHALQISSVPKLIVRETGTRLVNGLLDDMASQRRSAIQFVG